MNVMNGKCVCKTTCVFTVPNWIDRCCYIGRSFPRTIRVLFCFVAFYFCTAQNEWPNPSPGDFKFACLLKMYLGVSKMCRVQQVPFSVATKNRLDKFEPLSIFNRGGRSPPSAELDLSPCNPSISRFLLTIGRSLTSRRIACM